MTSIDSTVKMNLESTFKVINEVYLPMEKNNGEIKLLLEKYSSVISQSIVQVTGSKSINFPPKLEHYYEQMEEPPFRVTEELRQFLSSLTDDIKTKLDFEVRSRPDEKHSLLIIEFWRSKSSNLYTLYQELSKPEIGMLKSILSRCSDENGSRMSKAAIESFDLQIKELVKCSSEAKDNVKFLNTLERQFKNLQSNDFSVIEKTLPSLLKGLKVVFIISRHFKSDNKISSLLVTISNELCAKIQSLINIEAIFKDINGNPDENFLEEIIVRISHGRTILHQWKTLFEKTKEKLEEEGGDRWDFDQKPIKEKPEYMITVLDKFKDEVINELKKFVVLLGPRLKAVTGNTDRIDELILKVKNLSNLFIHLGFDPYEKTNSKRLSSRIDEYKKNTKDIQEKTIKLIETTFADLRSSESAFELLQKFINLQSLDHISEQLHRRYSNVLATYQKELNLNKELFEKGRNANFYAKNQPPVAGAISWKREIMHRIKTPILKFIKRSEEWNPEEMKLVKEEYKSFAKQLDGYEKEKLEGWIKNVNERAIRFLKEKILVQTGKYSFVVHFPEEFKVLINEAKHLDTLGYQLPKTILNIALQEKEYFRYAEKLTKMIEEYHSVVNSLSDIEQYLYGSQLKELTNNLNPVVNSFNLNTLGIYDFIANYKENLKHFVEMKNKVDEKKRMIEDILTTIENAQFIDESHFERIFFPKCLPNGEMPELDSLTKFYSMFESEIETTVNKLTENYKKINETMLPQIEFTVFKKQTGTNPAMRFYYQYWERRIYNSITKMIVRALLCLKTILSRPHHRPVPIFKVQSEFHYMKVITVPHQNEIRVTLNNLLKLVKDSAIHFPRWKPNTCIAFSNLDEGFEGEERTNFTFLRDINDNTVIKLLTVEISEIKKLAFSRLEKYKSTWEEDKGDYQDMYSNFKRIIWNQKNKFKIDKILEKNPTTTNFEFFIEYFNSFLKDFEDQPNEVNASFILVDFSNVKQSYINQCKEALTRIGNALLKIADKKTGELAKQIQNYNRLIEQEAETLQELKSYLNLLTEIRDSTMDFEFKLEDLELRYNILIKNNLAVNPEVYDRMKELKGNWSELLKKAFAMDKSLKEKKQSFADQTIQQLKDLQDEINDLHTEYFKRGSGSVEISLENGHKTLQDFNEKLEEIGLRKTELVTSQKLFNLEISSFPKLVEIEEDMRKLSQLYALNAEYDSFLNKYCKLLWIKVDFASLDQGKKKYLHDLKKLSHLNQNVLAKIRLKIEDFSKMLPIFEKLKCNNSFKDHHWEKLLNEIGYSAQEINFKAITLQNVFDFKLQEHVAKVDEIVNMSVQEGNNEDIIKGIETFWKNTSLEIIEYKKQNEKKGFVVKVAEEINLSLNDHLINLQNMEGSKYAQTLKHTIKQWVSSLNTIMETIEVWISVQRKWMYLESIFIGNEDMRQQLPKEAKTFENLHKTFKKINEQAMKNPNVYVNCVQIESTLPQLKTLATDFDKSQKSLSDYLNSKKVCFPRFYFISDDDLLSILGSSECSAITPHLMKLYDNCKALNIENNKVIRGMTSEESEYYEFKDPIKPEGAVEVWMSKVEAEMVRTLKDLMKEGVFYFAKMEKKKWIAKYLGMVVLAGVQIWWTWRVEDAFRKVHESSKYALKSELEKQCNDLKDLIDLVRSDLESSDPKGLMRRKVNTLIIIEVHQRDIVDRFVRDSILDVKEFGWESQLRFYWQSSINDMQIFQCAGKFTYGYEYQGLNGRLVITPLTDRCVMTLTTALSFNLGGAPAGPAGTGKTETCKDLAKSLAIRCIVTNCGENFDSFAMGNNFSGLCQTGFWGCFDEFNRINPDVLSVVSAQIKNIQNALNMSKKSVSLMNQDLNLIATIGIFVTMNPGYEGRSELPDNLKALFRPVVMVVPDNNIICENMLMSEGFVNARVLAKKMTVLYKLSREQLSKQYHYDFGLRALKSVLVMAGSLKRSSPDVAEDQVLMRALRDMNLPKFVNEDISLFIGLINDLFPGLQIDSVSRKDFQVQIEQTVLANGQTVNDKQVAKVIQLFETMLTRHTTMIVGPTSVGKTTIIEVLQKTQSVPGQSNVTIYPINPKAQTLLELYGDMDIQTRDWTDGILSKIFKVANEENEEESQKKIKEVKWILLDGDVDAVWIENMNSVMDDNKLLTLSNGDRIRLKSNCKLLFEVFDLQFASPATISRCGMVYVNEMCLELTDYYAKWIKRFNAYSFESEENIFDLLNEMFKKYVPPLIDYLFNGKSPSKEIETPVRFIVERTPLNLLTQLTNLFGVLLPESTKVIDANSVEGLFVFCLTWSFGACLVSADRERFAKAVRDLSSILLPNFSLFEGFYDMRDHAMMSWDYKLSDESIPTNLPITRVLIPTTDTVKYNYLLREFESQGLPVIMVGESGTAKTVIIENYLKSLDAETRAVMNMNFSSRTNSLEVQRNIENVCDKRRPGLYCPKGNKKLLVFIDELHMPQKDKYNTQQPIALLRFLIEKGLMYERGGQLEKRKYYDINFTSALLPHSAGYNKIDPRFLSLFNLVGVVFPDQTNVEKIYNTILTGILDKFPKEVRELSTRITSATLQFYNLVTAKLPRTPIKFHYVFNLRDLSKVYMGLAKSNLQFTSQPIQLIRLWRNECTRIFSDRLMTQEDLVYVTRDAMTQVVTENFDKTMTESVLSGTTVFCEFMDCNPTEPGFESAKLYREVPSLAEVKLKVEDMLETYNTEFSGKEMNLVVFNDAVEHLIRLMRVLSFPKGHSMLVGFGGSGKQSLTRLSAFIIGYSLFTISFKRNYKESNFKEDLLDMFLHHFGNFKPIVFMLTDVQIAEESFLELVNTILTVGVVTSLFDESTKNEVKNAFRDICRKETNKENGEEIWDFYCEFIRNNLHVVLCMSPAGESLRIRSRNFPGLVSSTSIDWFFSWPSEALHDVASHCLKDFSMEDHVRSKIQSHMVWVHTNVPSIASDFFKKTGRSVYSTPKNFLDFLNNFKRFFDDTRKSMDSTIVRYETGLEKLTESAEKIGVLKVTIAEEKEKVEIEKKAVEELLKEIGEKSEVATEKQINAKEKQDSLAIENLEIKHNREEADRILVEKLPQLEVARQKVSEIKKGELDYIKSLPSPPKLIQTTVTCLQIMRVNANANENEGWAGAKTMLSDSNLVNQLIDYSKDESKISKVTAKQIKLVDEKLKSINEELSEKQKTMLDVSPACAKLLLWVDAVKLLYDTNQIIKPLKEKVETLTKKKAKKEEELLETTELLRTLNEELSGLNEKKIVKEKVLFELTARVNAMEAKLFKAEHLIADLEGERIRWSRDKLKLSEKLKYLYSSVLLSSSFVSYCGPFDQVFRRQMFEAYKADLDKNELSLDEEFRLETLLSSEVEISIWNSQGLPSDELSVQNGILTTRASRYPLCVDPQLQAVSWLKKKEEKNLVITSFNDEANFARSLETCLKFKKVLLIENVNETVDPLIDPILEKNFIVKGGRKFIKLDNVEIEFFEKEFQLFMVTRLLNPKFSPEIFGKTSVVNYNVTFNGLKEQLLSEVVGLEQEEKERLRKQLISDMSEDRKALMQLEELLLMTLVNSTGSLLENEQLLTTLEKTKRNSTSISESLEKGNKTRVQLEEIRQAYINAAIRGAVLFFAMQKLAAISEMYQYSLSSYLEVFKQSIHDAKAENILINRINNIIDKLTHNTYDYVLLGIFERHKLMFSFQMTIMILEQEGQLNQKEYDFLIKGNTSFDEVTEQKTISWMSDANWKDLLYLNDMDSFAGVIQNITENESVWKCWFDSEDPEDLVLPAPFDKISKFQMLLFLRVFRIDRIVNGIKRFIINQFKGNEYYVTSPTINYKKILHQSNEKAPIVFILSPGADPINDVQLLANTEGFSGNKFKFLSLGQNMEKEAEELIVNASQRGHWAMLQNCDLLPKWLKSLEKLLENLVKGGKISKDFRLWLTTKPTSAFPLGILQNAMKIVTEPPDGLRFNMKAIASKLTEENLLESAHFTFKPLTYVLCFFHAILLDRRKYGKIGFNVTYDFNESDFRISFKLLGMYLNKSIANNDEEIPWESLKYLIGEAMYGGRVTDDYDRRVLSTYLDEYMGDFLFDSNSGFIFSVSSGHTYGLPEFQNLETLLMKINELPIIDSPNVFGLNLNSEITYYSNSAKFIFFNLLLMQSVDDSKGSTLENSDYLLKVTKDILEKVPESFPLNAVKNDLRNDMNPIIVFLIQEIERFNHLIEEIKNSLKSLTKALNGEIILNNDLESLAKSILNGLLPERWRRLAPQTEKNLSSWMIHFRSRIDQYNRWIRSKELNVVWISGLHFPEAYLTALVQNTCRLKHWALDKSTLFTSMTSFESPEKVAKPAEEGSYVFGLYMEGASWCVHSNSIVAQQPKQLITELPVMKINPIELTKLKLKDTIKVPVYVTQNRRNAAGVGHIFDADMRTIEHSSHWILQGIAIVLNTDQ